jgi:hypothetical protein
VIAHEGEPVMSVSSRFFGKAVEEVFHVDDHE